MSPKPYSYCKIVTKIVKKCEENRAQNFVYGADNCVRPQKYGADCSILRKNTGY